MNNWSGGRSSGSV